MILIVFFFKQKTAYEMRISDWSSDVCSSDLSNNCCVDIVVLSVLLDSIVVADESIHLSAAGQGSWVVVVGSAIDRLLCARVLFGTKYTDRKSVVSGQSVSVRVDLGGRSIIKKKKKT